MKSLAAALPDVKSLTHLILRPPYVATCFWHSRMYMSWTDCVLSCAAAVFVQGVKSLAAALPEAKSLTHLILRSTNLLDEGAAALAVALQPSATPLTSPTSTVSSSSCRGARDGNSGGSNTGGDSGGNGGDSGDSSSPGHALQVLDLSQNIICDSGAEAIAAAVEAGALPQLQQLAVVDNRYPFDWATVLQLQGLQVLQPGLRVDLGAPSSWCITPSAVKGRLVNPMGGLSGKPAGQLVNPPAGWTPATADGSDTSTAAAAAAAGAADALSISSEDLCGVCFDAPNALYVNDCKHQLCIECYKQLVKAAAAAAAASSSSRRHQQSAEGAAAGCAACPFCRVPMTGFRYSAWVQDEEEGSN